MTLNDLTISNGAADDGAGVYVAFNAGLVANDVIFEDNVAVYNGGAIYATGADVRLTNCTLDANDVTEIKTNDDSGGAAIFVAGSSLTIKDSKIINNGNKDLNRTNDDLVNAVLTLHDSDTKITGSVFENNTGIYGGAIAAQYINGGISFLTISGTNFTNNNAYTGGAIYTEGTVVDITDSIFDENNKAAGTGSPGYCAGGGGAMVFLKGSTVTISNITVNNSCAAQGGAICTERSTISIEKSTFENNYLAGMVMVVHFT